jgi:DMSO/TMAO reductase YedYZ molybdopterin-dependent catalytic subunit
VERERFRLRRSGRLAPILDSVAGGITASLTAGLVMLLIRLSLQVRSVPERAFDATLLVVPPDLFEAMLQRFGPDAKRYALLMLVVAILILMTGIGSWTIWRRWSVRDIVTMSLLFWLMVMVVLMPLTESGVFASAVINGTKAAIGGHLAVALAYAAALVAAGARTQRSSGVAPHRCAPQGSPGQLPELLATFLQSRPSSRRSALALSTGALSTLIATFAAARWGPKLDRPALVVVEPPHVNSAVSTPIPTSVPTPRANQMPTMTVGPSVAAPAAILPPTVATSSTPAPAPTPQPTVTPTVDPAKEFSPPPTRSLARDKGGIALQASRRSGQLTELITETDDFYIVSKNPVQDPMLQLADWRLRVDGDVQRPIEIDYRSLRNLPQVEIVKTVECISNFVTKCDLVPFGCDLISTARWKGARLKDVLALAGGLKPGVTSLVAIASDDYTTALPIEIALNTDTLVVYEMNGHPLSREHGYPARVLVPGRYGFKNAKWVIALRPLRQDPDDWYAQRSWTRDAIVKTMTRVDVPARGGQLESGQQRIAGVAYAGDRGIQKVEYSTDGGEHWHTADIIEQPLGSDVWVRWEGSFVLPAGATITLMARATDGTGEQQSEPFSLPQPDGSSGWHSLDVQAKSV